MTRAFSDSEIRRFVGYLNRVKAGEVEYDTMGICGNISEMSYVEQDSEFDSYAMVEHYSIGWDRHSGIESFPYTEDMEFGKWEGPNLEARHELIDYIIERIENETGTA